MNLSLQEIESAKSLIAMALSEDLGQSGDLTSIATIPESTTGSAVFVARSPGVVAGLPVAQMVFEAVDPSVAFHSKGDDGSKVQAGERLAEVTGPMRSILTAERTALNFCQRLSGIATLTRRYVDATGGRSKVLDTRKTTPGWRLLEKYAVRCGGGHNHRIGLYDAILIKDNHLAALNGDLKAAITAARKHAPGLPVEIEVDSFEMMETALGSRPEIILLDNMNVEQMKRFVARRNEVAPSVQLEASGGIDLDTIGAIAATGVDRISVGAITHSAPALDIALDYKS